jgi:GTP-binding protein HflX
MKTGRDTKRHSRGPDTCRASPSRAIPTPASPRSSTGSPTPGCSWRTSYSPPSTRRSGGPRPLTGGNTPSSTRSASSAQLPHQLVEAFRSTLEEVADADLLLHVVDGSHPDPEGQIAAVREVLAGVEGAADVPEVIVINKADIADPEVIDRLTRTQQHSVVVSARTGEGLEALLALVAEALPKPDVHVELLIPYDRGDLLSRIHERGEVLVVEHVEAGTRVRAKVHEQALGALAAYRV